jgi:hypothetical protein
MQNNYNFKTKTVIDPLADINAFYINPYMPDNMKLLGLKRKTKETSQDIFNVCSTAEGHVVILFPIDMLVDGPCHIKWTEEGKFCIDNRIWCKIMSDNIVRVDTVRW